MSARDIGLAILIMALWGLHYVVIRMGALEIPPMLLISLRFSLCALFFIPFAQKLSKDMLKNVFIYAMAMQTLHMGFLFAGLAQVDAAIGAIIMKAGVPFSIIIAWLFFKERFGLKTFAGLSMAFIGGFMVLYAPHVDTNITIAGTIFLILSALFWAIGSVRLKYVDALNFPTLMGHAFLFAAPFVILASLIFEENHIEHLKNADHTLLVFVLGYQVFLMSATHYWWKNLISRNPVYLVTPFSILTPIFGILCGVLILGEALSSQTVIGGLVALGGLSIIIWRKAQREKQT